MVRTATYIHVSVKRVENSYFFLIFGTSVLLRVCVHPAILIYNFFRLDRRSAGTDMQISVTFRQGAFRESAPGVDAARYRRGRRCGPRGAAT